MGDASKYISMVTAMSTMLLFKRSSRICRENVGSHAIIFKSLCFGPFTLKLQPQSFQTKEESAAFLKVSFFDLENGGVV